MINNLISKLFYIFDRQEKFQIGIIFLLMLGGAGIETLGVGLIPPFVTLLSNPEFIQQQQFLNWLYGRLGATSSQVFLLWISVILLGIYLFKNIYLSLITYWQYHFLYIKQVALSNRLLAAYLHSPYTFHLQRNSAELVRNITSEILQIFSGVLSPMLILVTELMVMSCIVILLAIAEPLSSAIAAELDRQGVIINLGWHQDVTIEQICLVLRELIGDRHKREDMSQKGRKLVDGNGASRVASQMLNMLA